MTQIATSSHWTGFTPSGLRTNVRALHQPRVAVMNVAWGAMVAALCLSLMGISAIGGVEGIARVSPQAATQQLVFLCLGLAGAGCVAIPHYRWVQRFSIPLMIAVLGALVFVLIPFVPDAIVHPRNGARRWINIGITDFQPSELAKLGYVLCLAAYLRYRNHYRRFGGLLMLLALTFIPMALVLVEPDLGTALIFLPTLFAMVIAAGAKMKHIVLIITLGLAAAPVLYPFLQSHQKDRIVAMLAQVKGDPRYEDGIGYQGARAMTLAGAGGVLGVGKDRAADFVQFNKLPEAHNDMVFALICCRWGMLGAVTIWALNALLCGAGIMTAALCKEPFGRLVAVGIVAIMFTQMTINTGMTIGLLPITGITLPFVSYGGSSMVTGWLMMGLLLNIGLRRSRFLARKSFEFDPEPVE